MATNLSLLIKDAFAIYSEAYTKIGQLGSEVVSAEGKASQPKKINQLIEATMIYCVLTPSINLNTAGNAIEGVTGDIGTVNALLLQLKRVMKLYDVPVFPTPLSVRTFAFSDPDECCDQLANVDTTAASIALDMANIAKMLFLGGSITSAKPWVFSNTDNARTFQFSFSISGAITGASHDQTMPANVKMSDARIVPLSSPLKWRPIDEGEYQAKATSYNNGTSWKLEISDVFS